MPPQPAWFVMIDMAQWLTHGYVATLDYIKHMPFFVLRLNYKYISACVLATR